MFNSLVFSVLFVARKSRIACEVISLNTPSALTPTSACIFSISPSVICFSSCAILASIIANCSKYVFVCISTSLSLRFIISCCALTSGALRSYAEAICDCNSAILSLVSVDVLTT